MKALFSVLLAAGLTAVAIGGDKEDAAKKELAKFAGEWQAVQIVNDGEEGVPAEEL